MSKSSKGRSILKKLVNIRSLLISCSVTPGHNLNFHAPSSIGEGISLKHRHQLVEPQYFEVRFRTEKYGVPYFLPKAKRSDPRKKAVGARARNAVEDLNVQVIRSYSWAATEEPHNSQCKPVNNCDGSHDFPETLVSSLGRWQPATDCAADLLRMDLNDLSRRSSLQLIEQVGHASG